ncbi:MAG: CaiB/BaiF CoA-transferase family protein [Pseudomonadota bacterium]
MAAPKPSGPLVGLRIVEFAGIGPAPLCTMLMADLGADVIRIGRPGATNTPGDVTHRSRPQIGLNLKSDADRETCLRLLEKADVLIEGFRPGVMERVGLSPEAVFERNEKIVYGRMTGWGQSGPLAKAAGHDLNYIAISGALGAMGRKGEMPDPPLNLVGDYGGGALYLAFGLLAGVFEAQRSGKGQVVDAAMTDGVASMMAMFYGFKAIGVWKNEREANFIDGGAHYYRVYECADGKMISVGALEPQFYAELEDRLALDAPITDNREDPAVWPSARDKLTALFKTKPRDEWCALLEGTDACVAGVLDMDEAPGHPHNVARQTFTTLEDIVQPAPAPRFSRTPGEIGRPAGQTNVTVDEALTAWGVERAG